MLLTQCINRDKVAAWNDLKLHKLKDENKKKHHFQTTPPKSRVRKWLNSAIAINNVREEEKRWPCGQMTCTCNNSVPVAK